MARLPMRTFDRRFEAATGCSPLAYVQAMRIEEAKHHLETGSLPIDEIGRSVGYRSSDARAAELPCGLHR